MSVSGIGFFPLFDGSYLSEELKRKLRALGIDPQYVTSVSQALALIREAAKNQKVEETQTFEQKMVTESESDLKNNEDTILQMLNMSANINKFIHKL